MSNDHRRQLLPCSWRGCHVLAIMPNNLCITHHYKAQGKEVPTYEPKPIRPPVDRNTVISGKRQTSQDAAKRALPSSGTKRRQVYDLIMANLSNGLTADEIQVSTGFSPNTINPTIKGLADDEWIYDSGERRPTRTGALAIVWVAI